jgi:hypothetical protein
MTVHPHLAFLVGAWWVLVTWVEDVLRRVRGVVH